MTSVSHLPTRRLKGVIQRPSSLPHGSLLDRLLLPFSANHCCPAGSAHGHHRVGMILLFAIAESQVSS